MEWMRGWVNVVYEMLFQRIMASHLHNPMPLPPLNDITCVVTGSTSGIGREIARQLAESGAHVVMAVRNPKAAHDLIQTWQNDWSLMGLGLPLNIEVVALPLIYLLLLGTSSTFSVFQNLKLKIVIHSSFYFLFFILFRRSWNLIFFPWIPSSPSLKLGMRV